MVSAFVVVCLVACGGAGAASNTGTATPGGQQAGSQDPSSTGVAECDAYIRMVSRCIETKMPESERASERQNLDYLRRTLADAPFMQAALGPQCKENMRRAVQNDSYECYAEEAAQAGIQTACSLLKRAELEEVLQAALENGMQQGAMCTYAFAGNPARHPFRITVHWTEGRDELQTARAAQAILNRRMQTDTGQTEFVPGATVEGLGDDAFFTLAGFWPMLVARRGDVAVSVEGATREELIAIARQALGRLDPQSQRVP